MEPEISQDVLTLNVNTYDTELLNPGENIPFDSVAKTPVI